MPTVLDHSCTCILSFFLEYSEKYKCYDLLEVTKNRLSSDQRDIYSIKLYLIGHGFLDVNCFIILNKALLFYDVNWVIL